MGSIDASEKRNEKTEFYSFGDKEEKLKLKCNLGDLVTTADNKKVLNIGDSANWSHKLHTITSIICETIPLIKLSVCPRDTTGTNRNLQK